MTRLTRIILAAAALAILAGCATGPRSSQGLTWVEEQAAERRRLQAQGFPQYSNN